MNPMLALSTLSECHFTMNYLILKAKMQEIDLIKSKL
jgi:hypothetical protein